MTRNKVRQETEFSYGTNHLEGHKRFEATDSKVVVTFDDGRPVSVIDSMSDAQEADDAIVNALPALLDGDGNTRFFVPDEMAIQFDEGVSDETARSYIADIGSTVIVEQRTPGYYTIAVPADRGLFETLDELGASDLVEFVEPSEVGLEDTLRDEDLGPGDDRLIPGLDPAAEPPTDTRSLPSDDDFPRLWGLQNRGQVVNGSRGTPGADMDATRAWDISTGAGNVIVAVIDTGCDLDHPDLSSVLVPQGGEDWDFADLNDPDPIDSGSHGTHVAGTAVGAQNNHGIVGVAPDCRLMPLRVNLMSGRNQNRADAINYVAGLALRNLDQRYVINCSWRMSGDHAGVRRAIRNAVRANVLVVFAAGNADRDIASPPAYPAYYPEVIAVAATDQDDERAAFSNFGKRVDVSAPGVNIWSTEPDDTYGFKDGTSMAAPHVAGLAALVWSVNPTLTNDDVRAIIERTCDDIDAKNPVFAGLLGQGRVNANRALRATPPPPIPSWTVRTIDFPAPNTGSSSAMTFIRWFWVPGLGWRSVLAFLTQRAGSEKVYFLDRMSGDTLWSVDPEANDTIGSLAWDGSALRVANVTTGSGAINRINPYTGSILGSLPVPAGRGEGLAWADDSMYYSTISRLHRIDPTTGVVRHSMPAPGGESRGLSYGRGLLFSSQSSTGQIRVFDPTSRLFKGVVQAPFGGDQNAEAIAFDPARRELYVANQSEQKIHVLRLEI